LDNTGNQELALRESLIIAASNRFFTLIPSVHPHIIRDKDDLTMKVCAYCLAFYSVSLQKYPMHNRTFYVVPTYSYVFDV
jgi:hypothetical protein